MNAATRSVSSLVAAFAVLCTLAGCSLAATGKPSDDPRVNAAPPAVAPAQTPAVDVPQVSAGLENQRPQAVPPVRLRIESLGIDMAVEPMGLAENDSMALPENPADASWYRYGSWPGSAEGSVVIAAHVDAVGYGLGPMSRLTEAVPGTEIIVTTADGSEVVYEVAEGGMVVKSDVPWASVFDRTGASRLTVVTCGGEFDNENGAYLSNVIVSALPRP